MLRLIPVPAHRLVLRSAHAVRLRWWRWRGRVVTGVRVLVRDSADRVLLVRHSYGSGSWMLPGGGLKRGEDPLAAAAREVREETGCVLRDAALVAVFAEALGGAPSRVDLVAGRADEVPVPDGREIIATAFFAPDALPHPLVRGLAEALDEWIAEADKTQSGII